MRSRDFILATLLVLVPIGAQGADLVVWWDEGYYAEEDEAVREIVAAFEQETGGEVELTFQPLDEHPDKIIAAVAAGRPPDFAFGAQLGNLIGGWALDDRLVDLTETVGAFSNLFEPDALAWWTFENGRTGQRALYALSIWAAPPFTSTCGRAFWSRRASRSRTSRRSGMPSGRSGAMTCSPPCAGRPDATTSGVSGFRCHAGPPTLGTS
jgi:ABC-type glycerol-3-phosphate transport system substrate-binding protein